MIVRTTMFTKDYEIQECLTLQPTDDHVLLRRLEDPNQSPIILTDEKPEGDIDSQTAKLAEVIAVGPGRLNKRGMRKPLGVEVGDVVWYGRFVDWTKHGFVIVQEADIVAVQHA